jgi:hypothetical protein
MNEIIIISAAMLTPVLGVLTAYIAWQQWRTNQLRARHDLYERRFAVFTALVEFLSLVVLQGTKTEDLAWDKFHYKTRESYFFFGREIPDYLDQVYNKAFDLYGKNLKISSANSPTGEELNRLLVEKDQLREWLFEELKYGARDKFSKYLKLY